MEQPTALRVAIDLFQVPSRVRHVREDALPEDMAALLRIAAGEADAVAAAVETTGRSPELLRKAATFYIEQILLAPGSDSYRVLGCTPSATSGDLRRNLALILRWLHPDVRGPSEGGVFAQRVTSAWETLKTAERRQSYDLSRRSVGEPAMERPKQRARIASSGAHRAVGAYRPRRTPLGQMLRRWLGRS